MSDKSLGEVLLQARKSRGLTLRDVQGRTGIHNAHLSQIETGKIARPEMAMLWELSELYDLPYRELLELSGHSGPAPADESRQQVAVALRALGGMSPDDRQDVMNYIDRLRRSRRE